jgi:F-type H+-transporting ATPase subunit epsilon
VIVLADSAERAEEIDVARAEEARRRAEAAMANRQESIDLAEEEQALRRASLRLQIGQRRRTPRSGGVVSGINNEI